MSFDQSRLEAKISQCLAKKRTCKCVNEISITQKITESSYPLLFARCFMHDITIFIYVVCFHMLSLNLYSIIVNKLVGKWFKA